LSEAVSVDNFIKGSKFSIWASRKCGLAVENIVDIVWKTILSRSFIAHRLVVSAPTQTTGAYGIKAMNGLDRTAVAFHFQGQ
jgi:hypothetical protein